MAGGGGAQGSGGFTQQNPYAQGGGMGGSFSGQQGGMGNQSNMGGGFGQQSPGFAQPYLNNMLGSNMNQGGMFGGGMGGSFQAPRDQTGMPLVGDNFGQQGGMQQPMNPFGQQRGMQGGFGYPFGGGFGQQRGMQQPMYGNPFGGMGGNQGFPDPMRMGGRGRMSMGSDFGQYASSPTTFGGMGTDSTMTTTSADMNRGSSPFGGMPGFANQYVQGMMGGMQQPMGGGFQQTMNGMPAPRLTPEQEAMRTSPGGMQQPMVQEAMKTSPGGMQQPMVQPQMDQMKRMQEMDQMKRMQEMIRTQGFPDPRSLPQRQGPAPSFGQTMGGLGGLGGLAALLQGRRMNKGGKVDE
jgi:hypothetical protein